MKPKGQLIFGMLPLDLQTKLMQTPQSPEWHPEGSVYKHIDLVSDLLPDEYLFQACAVLHDIGKAVTTQAREKNGHIKIQSIGHEQASIEMIKDLNLSSDIDVQKVSEIVSYHMIAHKYLDKTLTKKSKIEEIENLPTFEELKIFSEADSKGIGTIEDAKPIIVVTIGIPGSGKSTWAETMKNSFDTICPDQIRKHLTGNISDQTMNKEVWENAFSALYCNLEMNIPTIFDSTGCNVSTLKQIIQRVHGKGILVFKLFSVTPEEARVRIKKDLENGVERSIVPGSIVYTMNERLLGSVLPFISSHPEYLIVKEV